MHLRTPKEIDAPEIKLFEINANFMKNDFRIKKINAKEKVAIQKKKITRVHMD